jgi:hypothetical protein
MSKALRCRRCDEVIGAYEPLVVLVDGQARETSRAAEPDLQGSAGECYHGACFLDVRRAAALRE